VLLENSDKMERPVISVVYQQLQLQAMECVSLSPRHLALRDSERAILNDAIRTGTFPTRGKSASDSVE
jgi:hypothetical protein